MPTTRGMASPHPLMPAQAGIQEKTLAPRVRCPMGLRFRGDYRSYLRTYFAAFSASYDHTKSWLAFGRWQSRQTPAGTLSFQTWSLVKMRYSQSPFFLSAGYSAPQPFSLRITAYWRRSALMKRPFASFSGLPCASSLAL